MNIKYIKAGSGDCILISHQKHNILIDGGNEPDYLLAEISKIHDARQCIDLLVITHHDDDHINGMLTFLERVVKREYGDNFIKEIIFNSPRAIQGKIAEVKTHSLSYRQAYLAENLLQQLKTKWEMCTEQTQPKTFGSLKLRFLSPVSSDLDIYGKAPGAYLSSDFKCDWNAPINLLIPYLTDDSQDLSIANRTSIVIIVETEQRRVLLTGDITPDRLDIILDKLVIEEGSDRLKFDHIKLPHHGSYRSLNKAILEKLDCKKFIISTNSKKHYLPNKRALIKILLWLKRTDEEIEFIFNYEEAINNLRITTEEQKKYRLKLTKNNQTYGISI